MTDKQMYALLNKFINSSPLARDMEVVVTHNHKSFKPKEGKEGHYEDANLLASILMGAEILLFWLGRNGYKVTK